MNEAEFVQFVAQRATSHWNATREPYLIANLPSDLMAANGIGYKSIIGDQRLKEFIKATESQGSYRMIEHPSQKAKIGVIPSANSFRPC